jgi:hypothetical protein
MLRKTPAEFPAQITSGFEGATTTDATEPPSGPDDDHAARDVAAKRERRRAIAVRRMPQSYK